MAVLSKTAEAVLKQRYYREGEDFEKLCWRVAEAVAYADSLYGGAVHITAEKFYEMMINLDFLPNSPTLMNAGTPDGQLSACFVLPVGDSMEDIFEAVKQTALIHKTGGGTGFDFSRLRPAGDRVASTGGVASGPMSFMRAFDAATETVKQGGKRRGANMAVLRVDHPDIMDFIRLKTDLSCMHNFNVSTAITDAFMAAVKNGGKYDLVNPHTGQLAGELNAREVLREIATAAWQSGEPGVLFIDRANANNPTPILGRIEATNPCGEQPLLPYESCNLGSINLSNMIFNGDIHYDKLEHTVYTAVHFLDNVIDVNHYPLPEVREATLKTRKIGLGVMGFHDMLIRLGIRYSSQEAVKLARIVMSFVRETARKASCGLASARGVFPAWEGSIYDPDLPLRNAALTTIAPTGTLSIIAGCSSGVEPLFATVYDRHIMDEHFFEIHPLFQEMVGDLSDDQLAKIAASGMDAVKFSAGVRELFETAHDISPKQHVLIQAAFQEYTDASISKTINFNNSVSVEDIEDTIKLAYDTGCKGLTVYRDGCRENQVFSTGQSYNKPQTAVKRERPDVVKGSTTKVMTGCGALYVTVNDDSDGEPYEVFATIGKAGGCVAAQTEAIGRLVSLALRSGVPVDEIIQQLRGISCHRPAGFGERKILSCSDGIGVVLARHVGNEPVVVTGSGCYCPECGLEMTHEGGCQVCRNCGYSMCE
jgi:ribonucleoside-diphosphate reductase alpha chain